MFHVTTVLHLRDDDETKIENILRIKKWHSWFNRPGYLFACPLNEIIARPMVHKEFGQIECTEQTKQEYFKACGNIPGIHRLMLPSQL